MCERFLFSYQSFLSPRLATHRTAREGRRSYFIPLYHFHPLTIIQIFICNFTPEMTIAYIQSHHFYLPDCYWMKFTTLSDYHLIDWWCDVSSLLFACLFTWWFDSSFFVVAIWNGNRWTLTLIDYHTCITSRPTDQVH